MTTLKIEVIKKDGTIDVVEIYLVFALIVQVPIILSEFMKVLLL